MKNDRVVLLTGATGKLGEQFLDYFLRTDYTVVITSRSVEKIETLYSKYQSFYEKKKLIGLALDLEKETTLNEIIEFMDTNELYPNILVNNARNSEYLKKEKNKLLERKQWMGEFLVDVIVPYELSMGIAFQNKTKLENIINISSMYGIVAPNPHLYEDFQNDSPINYGVCKSGLIHLTKELAVRFSSRGIRVNCISYGGVEGRTNEDFKKRYAKLCPQGSMLKEKDVIGAIKFLSSEMSIGMTGHNLVVDGGWCIW